MTVFVIGDRVRVRSHPDIEGTVADIKPGSFFPIQVNHDWDDVPAWYSKGDLELVLELVEDATDPTEETQQGESPLAAWELELLERAEAADAAGKTEVLVFSDFKSLQHEAYAIFAERHLKYGPRNISDAPGGAFHGIVVRMHDKMARLRNYVEGDHTEYSDESIHDTLNDISNYALMARLCLLKKWPGTE